MDNSGQLFDVIVVGAGVMGSATAYQTAKRGLRTLLLEQFDFLHHRGSSHGESRTIRATYPDDVYPPMVLEASRLWEEAEAEAGYKVYYRTKHIDMGAANNKELLCLIDSCRKNLIPARVLTPTEVSNEFSGVFSLPLDWIGVITEVGGLIKPTKAVAMLQMLARQKGAVLVDNAEVTDFCKDLSTNEIVATTTDGRKFRAGKCVITAGPWTRKLIEKVRGIVLPIQPLETTAHYWKVRKGYEDKFTIESGFPTFSCYPCFYGTPSLEFPGMIKVPIHGGRNCEADDRTWATIPEAVEEVKEWIKGRFGEMVEVEEPVMTQSCMYSMTPDEDYVIDFVGGEFGEDAVVCGGFSGHGFKMATAVGRIATDMVVNGKAEGVQVGHFRVGRFQGNEKGNVKHFE